MSDLRLVLFSIGNPGPVTRHSMGHYMLKHLMLNYSIPQLTNAPRSKYAISKSSNGALVFAKSNTFMNESGVSFAQLAQAERLNSSSSIVLVLYDDFEAHLGSVRLQTFKKNESHNGIKSVQKCLPRFEGLVTYKLGIGIGPKPLGASSASMALWVLSPMNPKEKALADTAVLDLVVECIELLVEVEGKPGDLNKFNAKAKRAFTNPL